MMSRKHFNELAKILKETEAKQETIERIAEFCKKQNPRFQHDKFIEASNWVKDLMLNKKPS